MKLLEERITRDGTALNEQVLLVDSFLNHQVDPVLMAEVGRVARLAANMNVTRVATIESSGIAPAQMTALTMGLPLVIMKKSQSKTLGSEAIQTEVFSFTKNASYQLTVKPKYILPGDRVLLIDDFLANGEAASGAIRLIEQCGAHVAAVGIVIEKTFQPGRALIEGAGHRVLSLARIEAMGAKTIRFAPADDVLNA